MQIQRLKNGTYVKIPDGCKAIVMYAIFEGDKLDGDPVVSWDRRKDKVMSKFRHAIPEGTPNRKHRLVSRIFIQPPKEPTPVVPVNPFPKPATP